MVKFKKRIIDRRNNFEGASVCDVNNDGILDIVCGQYWYEGPHFLTRHQMVDLTPVGDPQNPAYQDDFSSIPLDVNGDGHIDLITGSFFNPNLRWRENPGTTGQLWKVHDIMSVGPIETTRFCDIDGDGVIEIFPNNNDQPCRFFKLITDADGKGTGAFRMHELNPAVQPKMGHGIGFGDITGNGLTDVITAFGWFENPGDVFGTWKFHDDFNFEKITGRGDLTDPALAIDITGNGLGDIICSHAHNYGLYWFEQKLDAAGNRTWIQHDIDTERAQYHDMQLVDIDNDGELELVTGKRWQAHCGNDPGDLDDNFVFIYKINGGKFDRFVVDEGPASEDHSGVGIYFWVADVTGNGYKDIICPGKEGLFLFENLGE